MLLDRYVMNLFFKGDILCDCLNQEGQLGGLENKRLREAVCHYQIPLRLVPC